MAISLSNKAENNLWVQIHCSAHTALWISMHRFWPHLNTLLLNLERCKREMKVSVKIIPVFILVQGHWSWVAMKQDQCLLESLYWAASAF